MLSLSLYSFLCVCIKSLDGLHERFFSQNDLHFSLRASNREIALISICAVYLCK